MAKNRCFCLFKTPNNLNEISVIGGGSWATALVKILTENSIHVNWYMRRSEQVRSINDDAINPDYLPFLKLDNTKIYASDQLDMIVARSKVILFVVPSAQLDQVCEAIPQKDMSGKFVITAIKGTVGPENLLPSAFIARHFELTDLQQAIIAGPCHAEEIARNKKTYITLCGSNESVIQTISNGFASPYMEVHYSADMIGVEYAAIYKNVVGIVCGMAEGLHYGDNFMAVLVANAIDELGLLLQAVGVPNARLGNSTYLGDLLVTGYSRHSRNRKFGQYLGQGFSAFEARGMMGMVAEGYYATKGLMNTVSSLELNMPLLQTAYRVLYNHMAAKDEFKLLERNIR
ncbi:NAD(P)H-dependent glycerol-3-phosphate dehydrogenase [Sphingobacterium sp. UBA7855]|uniref:NAD(P)H-dependent glycerol-3-phosphate dehydrogenase n=1 Tax=Sphingobacterium sp. UBA7855 TaxID=1947526 RepID=UPI0025D8ACAD|nr:NAD(P)H-dependent glycerol-3-phosphate dehydrogenase [Sphingobacterium sp. UBA7855]